MDLHLTVEQFWLGYFSITVFNYCYGTFVSLFFTIMLSYRILGSDAFCQLALLQKAKTNKNGNEGYKP